MAGRGSGATGLLAAAAVLLAAPAAAAASTRAETQLQRDVRALVKATTTLHRAIDTWRKQGDPSLGRAPRSVQRAALHQQQLVIRLSTDPRRAEAVVGRIRGPARKHVQAMVRARLALMRLGLPQPRPLRSFRPGTPLPAEVLLRHYRRAQRRFGVGWHILAAVNFVESGFGRIRTPSSAGALGPMQFMPATWEAYGRGGNVFKARDSIMGAANYLRASGAPRNNWGALYAYNHSGSYVEAVLRYAGLMNRDLRAFYSLYSWEVFIRTPSGLRRLGRLNPGTTSRPASPARRRAGRCCLRRVAGEPKGRGRPVPLAARSRPATERREGAHLKRAPGLRDSIRVVRSRGGVRLRFPEQALSAWTSRGEALRGWAPCCTRQLARERTGRARSPPRVPRERDAPVRSE